MTEQKPHSFSLSDFHWDKLTEYANNNHINRSEALRRLIADLDIKKKEEE